MSRCDFFSVAQLLLRYIYEKEKINQSKFIELLFKQYCDDNKEGEHEFSIDTGLICRWISGDKPVSPKIYAFYKAKGTLADDIQNNIFPLLYDLDKVIEEAYNLVLNDFSISEKKKAELTDYYPYENPDDVADYLADIIMFALSRKFISRKELEAQSGLIIPLVTDMIYIDSVPKPCKHFCGRDRELDELHKLFLTNSKIFITGVAGIGKSELSKAYASKYKKEYKTILFLSYRKNLLVTIADMDFADDKPEYNEQTRFKLHNRYLRALKEDTLIIIDNFNTSASKEELLGVVMKYNCNIIFTTRSRFECGRTFELKEIESVETLFDLSTKFYRNASEHKENITEIIDIIHHHTFSVELSARLLQNGMAEPDELLAKLKENSVIPNSEDEIEVSKDGQSLKHTYFIHLHLLFSLDTLKEETQKIMRCMVFAPAAGIRPKLFAKWLNLTNLNGINDLIELGFIKENEDTNMISLLPIMRDICLEDLKPSYTNCAEFLRSIQEICCKVGEDILYANTLFATAENIIRYINVDTMPDHLYFIHTAFLYMQKYRYESGMRLIVDELEQLLKDNSVGVKDDRAMLYSYKAACVGFFDNDNLKAIELCKKALSICVPEDNVVLYANLNSNLGLFYERSGNFEYAYEYFNIAKKALSLINFPLQDFVEVTRNLYRVLGELGRQNEALSAMMNSVEFLKQQGLEHNSDCADIYLDIGGLNLYLLNKSAGLAYMEKAFSIYREILDDSELQQRVIIAQNYFKRAGITSMPDYLEKLALTGC